MTDIIGHGLATQHNPERFDMEHPTKATCAYCDQPAQWAKCDHGHDTYVCMEHLYESDPPRH